MTSWCIPIQGAGVHVAECGASCLDGPHPGVHHAMPCERVPRASRVRDALTPLGDI